MEGAIAFYHLFAKPHYQRLKIYGQNLWNLMSWHTVFLLFALWPWGRHTESRVLSSQAKLSYYEGMDRKRKRYWEGTWACMLGRDGFSADLLHPSRMWSSHWLHALATSEAEASVLQAKKITDHLLFSNLWAKCTSSVISFDFCGFKLGKYFKQFVSSVICVTATTQWVLHGHGVWRNEVSAAWLIQASFQTPPTSKAESYLPLQGLALPLSGLNVIIFYQKLTA